MMAILCSENEDTLRSKDESFTSHRLDSKLHVAEVVRPRGSVEGRCFDFVLIRFAHACDINFLYIELLVRS